MPRYLVAAAFDDDDDGDDSKKIRRVEAMLNRIIGISQSIAQESYLGAIDNSSRLDILEERLRLAEEQRKEDEAACRRQQRARAIRDMASHISISLLPQENGRFVARARSFSFEATSYGDTEQEAIANALESYTRVVRHFRIEGDE